MDFTGDFSSGMLTSSGKVHQQGDADEKNDDRNPEMGIGEDCG
jgi:hypothetical protein